MANFFDDLSGNLTLKEKSYINIKMQIMNGNLKPGSHLSESKISEAMNISRGPIREALNMLVKEGFATMVPRKGAVVTSVTKEHIKNIWEVRKVLEPYAAQISTEMVSDEELDAIENTLKEVLKKPDDFKAYINSDLMLHELFYKHIQNSFLNNMLIMAKEHSLRIRYCAEESEKVRTEVVRMATSEHLEIIYALRERNEKSVKEKVLKHLENSENRSIYSVK